MELVQLRICPMGYSRKGYIKIGDYIRIGDSVEVRIPKMASYSAVATHAMEMLQLEEEGEKDGVPSIFRIDGTVVPESVISDLPGQGISDRSTNLLHN